MEHAEIFWSLFATDMDQVLAEQPPDTWDSFPLFQIMNDYLRIDGESEPLLTTFSLTINFRSTNIIFIIHKILFWEFPFFFPDNLKNGRFHQHLRDTFAPLVVRYVDLMESSIAQSIHKGFEKERWEIKG